jgi:tRNA(Ile)-lysidine synthase
MQSLFNAVKKFCCDHGFDHTYFLAFSGGLDSTVLLHLLLNIRSLYPIKLRVIHIHHGLSENASAWAEHCEKLCSDFSIDCTVMRIDAKSTVGESPEEVARERRYAVFQSLMQPQDILLTAHHQDDQAETILLQLFRGAGPKGLAAMSPLIKWASGFLARPLLAFSRSELQAYAEHYQLQWIDDESNNNLNFTRNFIRHEVLALLKKRWPSIQKTLSRTAEHCAEAQQLIENFSQQDLTHCRGSQPNTLSVKKILAFDVSRQRQVIRLWLQQHNFPIPSTRKMQHILHDLLQARVDKTPHITWGQVELRRYRDDIYVMKQLEKYDNSIRLFWDFKQPLSLPNAMTLNATPVVGQGLRADVPSVSVQFRQGSEACRLPGRKHHHLLKNLFQEWGVPTWERDRVPLLFVEQELAVVVGYGIAEKFQAKNMELGFIISS